MQNLEINAVTFEGDDPQPIMNQVLLSDNAEFYLILPSNDQTVVMQQQQISKIVFESSEFDSIQQLDARIEEYIAKDETGKWRCNFCHKILKCKSAVRVHAETHIKNISFPCPYCDAKLSTRNSLRKHKNQMHWNPI